MAIDYQNGKIYAIRSPKSDKVYIGATTLSLIKRFTEHRHHYKKWIKTNKSQKEFVSSFLIIDLGEAYIELIEECPCKSRRELMIREAEVINAHINSINIHRTAFQTKENYNYQRKEYSRKIREQDREKYNQYHREYRLKLKLKRSSNYDINIS